MKTLEEIVNSTGREHKIIIHKDIEPSSFANEINKTKRNFKLMVVQWLKDYSEFQTKNNIRNGAAGTVELFN